MGAEAGKLLAALEQWLAGHRGRPAAPECAVCPVCAAIAVVRGARPEVIEHLTAAASSVLLAAKAAVDADTGAVRGGGGARRVERIDIA